MTQPIPDADGADGLDAALALAFGPATAPDTEEEPPPTLPDRYQRLGEIGRGGLGVVHRARDRFLHRDVAIKVLRSRRADDPDTARRFFEEAQVVAQLQHPGIVPVHEVGMLPDGRPYFAMRLVEGERLDERLRRLRGEESRLEHIDVFAQLVATVAYAHSRGVVHRDLKPANVMVGAFGEVLVLDWGMAKVRQAPIAPAASALATLRTLEGGGSIAGSVCGTPGYMAPEQARGETDRIDARTDVFGLGAILCQVLTGSPACDGDPQQRIDQAARGEFGAALASLAACGAEASLVQLARDCLAVDPQQRPATAAVVAERLRDLASARRERLRQSEIELAGAAAERRARRIRNGLTLSLLGAAAALSWLQFERQRTRADLELAVLAAVADVGPLQQAAERTAASVDWQVALAAARLAANAARNPAVSAALRERAERLQQHVEAATAEAAAASAREQRDRDMVRRLEAIREGATRAMDWPATAAAYEAVFDGLGLRITDPPEHAIAICRESRIADDLIDGLDDYLFARFQLHGDADPDRVHWRAIVDGVDPGRDRQRIRTLPPADGAALLRFVAESEPSRFDARTIVLLGNRLARAGQRVAARELLWDGWLRHPGEFWIAFHLAFLHWSESPPQPAEAARWFEVCVAHRPDSAPAFTNLGIALVECGQRERGLVALRRAVELAPDLVIVHYNLAQGLLVDGEPEAAAASLATALALAPDDAPTVCRLASVLARLGQVDAARGVYESALARGIETVDVHLGYGSLLCDHIGDVAAAEAEFHRVVGLAPDATAPWWNLAMAAKRRGDEDAVRTYLGEVLARDARHADSHLELARLELLADRFDEAAGHARTCLGQRPDHGVALAFLGYAERGLGRLREAAAALERAVAVRPGASDVRRELASTLEQWTLTSWNSGDLPASLTAAEHAVALDPTPVVRCRLGASLHEARDFSRAAEVFGAVGDEGGPAALARYGDCLLELGRWQQAGEVLRKCASGGEPVATFAAARLRVLAAIERLRSTHAEPWAAPTSSQLDDDVALARLCQVAGRPADAVRFLVAAVQSSPADDADLQLALACASVQAVAAEDEPGSARLQQARTALVQFLSRLQTDVLDPAKAGQARRRAHALLLDERLRAIREPDGAYRGGFDGVWREVRQLAASGS